MELTAIGARAISDATQRFTRASETLLDATREGSTADIGEAIVDQITAKAQYEAGLGTVRIADEMMQALLELGQTE